MVVPAGRPRKMRSFEQEEAVNPGTPGFGFGFPPLFPPTGDDAVLPGHPAALRYAAAGEVDAIFGIRDHPGGSEEVIRIGDSNDGAVLATFSQVTDFINRITGLASPAVVNFHLREIVRMISSLWNEPPETLSQLLEPENSQGLLQLYSLLSLSLRGNGDLALSENMLQYCLLSSPLSIYLYLSPLSHNTISSPPLPDKL